MRPEGTFNLALPNTRDHRRATLKSHFSKVNLFISQEGSVVCVPFFVISAYREMSRPLQPLSVTSPLDHGSDRDEAR
jgi:hypothetical protein